MAIYGAFAAPILGMLSQSTAFGSISQNISNMNTGGYKASHTSFSTVMASKFGNNSDIGGLQAQLKNNISLQGRTISTNNPLDIAINGKGMFLLNTELDGSGEELYTRDGALQMRVVGTATTTLDDGSTATIEPGYLVDKNGHFVMAWEPDSSGNFSTSSSTSAVRLDNDAFDSEAAGTDNASLAINLPALSSPGDTHSTVASVYDDTGELQTFELIWTRQTAPQTWTLHVRSDADADPDADVLGATTTPAISAPVEYVFDGLGQLPADTSQAITINYSGGESVAFDLDLENVSSIGESFLYFDFQKDGRGAGKLLSIQFDASGQILGKFTNGVERALYKLPLATFVNPDGLEVRQGNLFAESTLSGSAVLRQVKDPAVVVEGTINNQEKSEFGTFVPFAHELANTNLESEFSTMILTQQAYNSAAMVFKSIDEMTQTAAELKTG